MFNGRKVAVYKFSEHLLKIQQQMDEFNELVYQHGL